MVLVVNDFLDTVVQWIVGEGEWDSVVCLPTGSKASSCFFCSYKILQYYILQSNIRF